MEKLVLELIAAPPSPTPTPEVVAVGEFVPPTPTPQTTAARPAATPTTSECYDVRSEVDGLEVVSVDPQPGTVLEVGAAVTIVVEVRYGVDPHDGWQIALWAHTANVVLVEISGEEGTVTLEGTFQVPEVRDVYISMVLWPPPSAAYGHSFPIGWRL